MIQGYAIYLRTHRETGMQYGGCCWWTKPQQTPEKACHIRWKVEDKAGIRGLFGGFDSVIVTREARADGPTMSDGLYRIRIAVDEDRVIAAIPQNIRLNAVSPLIHLDPRFAGEETCRIGGRVAAQKNKESGLLSRFGQFYGQQAKELGIGIHSLTVDQRKEASRRAGNSTKANGNGIFKITPAQRKIISARGVATNRKNKTSIFGLTSAQLSANGKKAAAIQKEKGIGIFGLSHEQRQALGKQTSHKLWHVTRLNPACELCVAEKING